MRQLFLFLLLTSAATCFSQTKYEEFCGNVFCVDLPTSFTVEEPYEGNNTDSEIYTVTKGGVKYIKINSTIESHVSMDTSINNIKDLYKATLKKYPKATYTLQQDNWFVISGVDKKTGNVYYWKKIWQGEFMSDLYIEYPKSRKEEIEPYIATISKSFVIHWVQVSE